MEVPPAVIAEVRADSERSKAQVKRRQIDRTLVLKERLSIGIRIICHRSWDKINLQKRSFFPAMKSLQNQFHYIAIIELQLIPQPQGRYDLHQIRRIRAPVWPDDCPLQAV